MQKTWASGENSGFHENGGQCDDSSGPMEDKGDSSLLHRDESWLFVAGRSLL